MTLPSRAFVISEVDREFRLQHPEAPRQLDPNDPAQAHLVGQWNEMYREFLNATVDSHFFRFFPNAPRRLDPSNPGDTQLIEYWNDLRDAIEGKPARYNWDDEPRATPTSSEASSAPPGPVSNPVDPTAGLHMDENAATEAVLALAEEAHYVGDTGEILGYFARATGAGEEAFLVAYQEVFGAIGAVGSVIVVLIATWRSFGTGLRLQEQEGFCYGVMWEVFGLPNADKQFVADPFHGTAEEMREAFYDGVAAGREQAAVARIHNRIMLATTSYQANGDDLATAQTRVLDELWLHFRETDSAPAYLLWPNPANMQE